jgi:hypothetical protein
MILFRAIFIAAASIMIVSCASSPTQLACDPHENPAIVFRPPLDSIRAVTSQFKPSAEIHFSGIPTPPTEYRPYAKLWIEVDSNGTPIDVRMPVGSGYESSGNRTVDRAILNWAKGIRFSPDRCKSPTARVATVPVDLQR